MGKKWKIADMQLLVKCYDIKMVKLPGGSSALQLNNNNKKSKCQETNYFLNRSIAKILSPLSGFKPGSAACKADAISHIYLMETCSNGFLLYIFKIEILASKGHLTKMLKKALNLLKTFTWKLAMQSGSWYERNIYLVFMYLK